VQPTNALETPSTGVVSAEQVKQARHGGQVETMETPPVPPPEPQPEIVDNPTSNTVESEGGEQDPPQADGVV
ncbi:MAG: hypothetical protein HY277_09270, partial [Ignavibacteriales bacterium]|nr:hypothetical protein [Ignavibacteriales bacterium]